MYFLKSFAYAGVAAVAFVATASIVITRPRCVARSRLDALDITPTGASAAKGGLIPVHKPVKQLFWYRSTSS